MPVSDQFPIAFHTDSSKRTLPDIVALTCVHNAEGGDTLLADAESAFHILNPAIPGHWTSYPVISRELLSHRSAKALGPTSHAMPSRF